MPFQYSLEALHFDGSRTAPYSVRVTPPVGDDVGEAVVTAELDGEAVAVGGAGVAVVTAELDGEAVAVGGAGVAVVTAELDGEAVAVGGAGVIVGVPGVGDVPHPEAAAVSAAVASVVISAVRERRGIECADT
ncbi:MULTISPECIES: hypothetical protein [unclassified Luteococcus]|uniref:hypothetical protein n=1 Tax=unclassified Luteococcus TaxID=2639923 RepID=UPI00313D1513